MPRISPAGCRSAGLLVLCAVVPAFAAKVQLFPPVPNGAISRAMQLDAAGNIYLAGSITPANPRISQDTSDAFAAKISADGSKLLYFVIFGGQFGDNAAGIAVGPDGSAYVTGSTGSSDFPVTAGAYQTAMNPQGALQGFLVKVDPSGTVVYSSYINGSVYTQATGILLGKAGEVYLTGTGGPGYPAGSGQPAEGFVVKLDATLHNVLLSEYGYGGGLITLDSQGNIFLAGVGQAGYFGQAFGLPVLPAGAFQSTHTVAACSQSHGPGGPSERFCPYQLVAKLDATGRLLWATYVTGTYGATPASMAVDSAGNVIVAGTTNSDDYPVTVGAFQTAYTAAEPSLPNPGVTSPPNSIGYVTKVNASGTGLVWSTYFGGSAQDQITGMAVSPSGAILLSGRAASSDLFFADTPDGCRPSPNQVLGYVARMAPDGASVGATQPVTGAPDCLYINCYLSGLATYQSGWPIALRSDGTVVVAGSNGTVASLDFSSSPRIACVTDSADNAQLSSVAPGQLVSFFGADLGSGAAVSVSFNGTAAPVLYGSAQQINVQVPYEIAGASTVQMQVTTSKTSNPASETHTLHVADRQPSLFLSPAALLSPYAGFSVCGGTIALGAAAVALNADGTLNDCTDPAAVGSVVTVFLNGFGAATPPLATGAIAPASPVALTPSLDPGLFTGTTTIAILTVPGAISGVAQVQLRAGSQTTLLNGASLGGVRLRERVIVIWTR